MTSLYVISLCPDHLPIYTDGSKSETRVACVATANRLLIQVRLPDSASIFSAELLAIYEVLTLLECAAPQKYTILYNRGFDLVILWCPSHIGVVGNERADLLAKEALSFTACDVRIPAFDFNSVAYSFYRDKWQALWSLEQNNKLHSVQPIIKKLTNSSREDRRKEIVLARARIGHTHLTHGYLLRRELPPFCVHCQCPLTVKHILIECVDFYLHRQRYFDVLSIKRLFEEVAP
ncbi:hypothetical protein CAPTEDRAFT_206814 [Capitella teleta]|uniref:Uncharacterized protein n=1 Tax=Capitella teleta TaxID=283909 RepID=R7VB23_CAPTE|nr:hypothetical protein CAPTEDRAFT_206814 [Capitella teleta]|eukprot:ELU16038.1 hypothetical protein CAPTEDRAFT_206814 [Capitella teleta]